MQHLFNKIYPTFSQNYAIIWVKKDINKKISLKSTAKYRIETKNCHIYHKNNFAFSQRRQVYIFHKYDTSKSYNCK